MDADGIKFIPGAFSPASQFYITGGTLRYDAPSYVERQADKDLFEGLRRGDFCYVLTSRQMGKSSLMVRTVRRLRQEKVQVAVLDLTAIGQNLNVEQWYDGLMSRLGQQLDLEDELLGHWQACKDLGPLQRWTTAIEKVILPKCQGQIIIFVDEIDIVRSLPFSTDEFFAAIRECYNRRSHDPQYNRLAFCLLGVATPTDLIRDTRLTPFNIGKRIELNDFTPEEAVPLAGGLAIDAKNKKLPGILLERILHWTNGHPYLTQRLCQAVAEIPEVSNRTEVDRVCSQLFLSPRAMERDDNLLFVRDRILRSETDLAALLELYGKVHQEHREPDDETNPLVSLLRLSGIVRVVHGCLEVRNRIYHSVFDRDWIISNTPGAETRRQKGAFRKGLWRGVLVAVLLFFILDRFKSCNAPELQLRRSAQLLSQVRHNLLDMNSCQDQYETSLEIMANNQEIFINASGTFQFLKPNFIRQVFRTSRGTNSIEVRSVCDGTRQWTYVPGRKEYTQEEAPGSLDKIALNPSLSKLCGPLALAPMFRLWLYAHPDRVVPVGSTLIRDLGWEEGAEKISWDLDVSEFLHACGWLPGTNLTSMKVPLTIWVFPRNELPRNGLIRRMQLDFTSLAADFVTVPESLKLNALLVTIRHFAIQWQNPLSTNDFRFAPGPGMRRVEQFDKLAGPVDVGRLFKDRIASHVPTRFPDAPAALLDLSPFYNASLVEGWHSDDRANDYSPLTPGILHLGGVWFDVRGLVQLSGEELLKMEKYDYPKRISGIKLGRKAQRLHFLQACSWKDEKDVQVGSYIVHYADGQRQEIPIVYGEDVHDWHIDDNARELLRATVVWSGRNHSRAMVGLYKFSWDNPFPNNEITSLEFVSAMSKAAPFVVAITAEP